MAGNEIRRFCLNQYSLLLKKKDIVCYIYIYIVLCINLLLINSAIVLKAMAGIKGDIIYGYTKSSDA